VGRYGLGVQISSGKLGSGVQTVALWRIGDQKLGALQPSLIGQMVMEVCDREGSFMA
jgi:hypothetical protein